MADHTSSRSGWVWVTLAVAAVFGTTGVAWARHVSSAGEEVARNVVFLETDVSGMSREHVRDLVEARAEEVLGTEVVVDVGDRSVGYEASELGFTYEVDGVIADVMRTRHTGNIEMRVIDWLTTATHTIARSDRVGHDPGIASEHLEADPALVLAQPVEPRITMNEDDEFVVSPGQPGGVVDIADLVERISAHDPASGPIRLDAKRSGLPPKISDEEAQAMADSLNQITDVGAEISVGSAHASIGSNLLRQYVDVQVSSGGFLANFDVDRFHGLLEGLIPGHVSPPAPPVFDVDEDRPILVAEGKPPRVCCDHDSVRDAAELIMAGATGPVRVEPRPIDDPRWAGWASGEDVTEQVGEFTTRHACCQGRVENIHRIADIVRGIYLTPGESVSLNEYVGQRTREKGFVAAGAIRSGHLEDEVGGGVSQFATTIFNAAFFAGLDIPVYQAHSLYFSRYPFGREATISHPAPDLVLENTTDHPVLIWTSYTDTSITVTMYSTPHVEVEQVDQRVGRWRECRYVETDRQRTYPDGREVIDTFEALYRPADGIDCNGNVIPRS